MGPLGSGSARRERPASQPWRVRLLTNLSAWLVAWVVVVTLLSLFGDELGSLPLALRALVISGVLVAVMLNLVMPVLVAAVTRWMAGARR
jgi:antibiotic biosynthesis monooxygenase (ABM) superfamily enzyme